MQEVGRTLELTNPGEAVVVELPDRRVEESLRRRNSCGLVYSWLCPEKYAS